MLLASAMALFNDALRSGSRVGPRFVITTHGDGSPRIAGTFFSSHASSPPHDKQKSRRSMPSALLLMYARAYECPNEFGRSFTPVTTARVIML